ncbi:unnamed protein product, partial [Mesorhabditis belari]|uniref:Uncharacterized protein n=1 Tax=Mesorhabditis belari TaxID=2138241 RepID=A0AAF3FAX8_9BILA
MRLELIFLATTHGPSDHLNVAIDERETKTILFSKTKTFEDLQSSSGVDILLLDSLLNDTFAVYDPKSLVVAARCDSAKALEIKNEYGFQEVYSFSEPQEKDFFEIQKGDDIYIMPKNAFIQKDRILYPNNTRIHSRLWQYGKRLSCENVTMVRNTTKVVISHSDMPLVAFVRDLILRRGSIPFIVSGTLLGWYRECSIIPHTRDMDFASFHYECPFDMLNIINTLELPWLWPYREYGRPDDNWSFTMEIRGNSTFWIDIFTMYYDEKRNVNFVSALAGLQKMKYTYTRFDTLCAVDLLNYVFYAPCDPEAYIRADYGPDWRIDVNSLKYHYDTSPKNAEKNGKFLAKEKSEVIREGLWDKYPRKNNKRKSERKV